MTKGAKWLLGFALLACFSQFTRSIDFKDYLLRSGEALDTGFRHVPYPVGTAKFGDFFQSPVVVLILAPLSRLPLFTAKLLWALLSTVGVVWAFRSTVTGPVNVSLALFLLFVFAHPLSDVYLSANINFAILILVYSGWLGLESRQASRKALGGSAVALAILIKLQPALFLGWYLLRRKYREAGWIAAGLALWLGFTYLLLPGGFFVPWWKGWWEAVALYHQSAYAGTVAYQSPPAAFFRALTRSGSLSYDTCFRLTGLFSAFLQGSVFLAAWFAESRGADSKVCFAFLLSTFFLGGPFSWALTVLFCFPLIYLAGKDGPGLPAWTAATVLALIPQALWPRPIWQQIAETSLPAACLAALCALAFLRLFPRKASRIRLFAA